MKPKRAPRNPFVAVGKFRKAGSHTKAAKQSPEPWQKRISSEYVFALISANLIAARPFCSM